MKQDFLTPFIDLVEGLVAGVEAKKVAEQNSEGDHTQEAIDLLTDQKEPQ